MARLVFFDDQTNCLLEQVPHRWGGIPNVSIASLWADTMDLRGGWDRDQHVACSNRFADANYQSSIWAVSSIHAKTSEGVREVTGDGLADKVVLDLASMVEISETDAFNAAFPARRFARVHLVLKDGRTVSSETTEAQGDPENKVSDRVIWDKFATLTTPVLGPDWAQTFLTNARALPEQSSVADLFTQMAVKG
jgi:hypothetical protein